MTTCWQTACQLLSISSDPQKLFCRNTQVSSSYVPQGEGEGAKTSAFQKRNATALSLQNAGQKQYMECPWPVQAGQNHL